MQATALTWECGACSRVFLPAQPHEGDDLPRAVLDDAVHVGPVAGLDAQYQLLLTDGICKRGELGSSFQADPAVLCCQPVSAWDCFCCGCLAVQEWNVS